MEDIYIGAESIVVSPPEVNPPVTVLLSEIACSADGCNNEARAGRCEVCKQVHYCSQACQTAHWNDSHQTECHIGLRLPWKKKAAPAKRVDPTPPKVREYAPGRGRDAEGQEYIIRRSGGMTVTTPDYSRRR